MSKILVPRTLKYDSCSDASSNDFVRATPGRKRKLDHLSYEEKVQRKKLKNRVAAQTSRDRKKKQMEEMQDTIDEQSKQICQLERRCEQISCDRDKILAKYEKLDREYQKLKARTSSKQEARHSIPEEHKYTRSASEDTSVDGCVGSFTIKTEGSAESPKPLLKVTKMEIESTKPSTKVQNLSKSDVKSLVKVIMLCFLYRSSSKTSSSTNSTWSNLQKVCSKMSRQTWKQVVQQAASQMPRSKANNSHCLNNWWGPKTQEWNPPKIEVA
jgi:Basic region leucine zipper